MERYSSIRLLSVIDNIVADIGSLRVTCACGFVVTVPGLVGGAPAGETPRVAESAGACRVFRNQD